MRELIEIKRDNEKQIKSLELELIGTKQHIASLMKISDDNQEKLNVFAEKEVDMNRKNYEYSKMIQELNEEKETYSVKERKFQREIQKLIDEHRDELSRKSDVCDKMLKASKKACEERLRKKNEEIYKLQSENEELNEKLNALEDQLKEANERLDKFFKQ